MGQVIRYCRPLRDSIKPFWPINVLRMFDFILQHCSELTELYKTILVMRTGVILQQASTQVLIKHHQNDGRWLSRISESTRHFEGGTWGQRWSHKILGFKKSYPAKALPYCFWTFALLLVCACVLFHHEQRFTNILAASVNVECDFSGGRRQVNFMQTNMSHDTFKPSMALGSWCDTPFYHTVWQVWIRGNSG